MPDIFPKIFGGFFSVLKKKIYVLTVVEKLTKTIESLCYGSQKLLIARQVSEITQKHIERRIFISDLNPSNYMKKGFRIVIIDYDFVCKINHAK